MGERVVSFSLGAHRSLSQVIAHYFPRLVELHNYPPANSTAQKLCVFGARARLHFTHITPRIFRPRGRRYNWDTLNARVLRKLGFTLDKAAIEGIIACKPMAIERALHELQKRLARYRARQLQAQQAGQDTPGGSALHDSSPRPPPHGGLDDAKPAAEPARGRAPDDYATSVGAVGGGGDVYASRGGGGGAAATLGASGARALEREVDTELLQEREREVIDLRETIEILELKIAKLEQLVRLKDAKIAKLQNEAS